MPTFIRNSQSQRYPPPWNHAFRLGTLETSRLRWSVLCSYTESRQLTSMCIPKLTSFLSSSHLSYQWTSRLKLARSQQMALILHRTSPSIKVPLPDQHLKRRSKLARSQQMIPTLRRTSPSIKVPLPDQHLGIFVTPLRTPWVVLAMHSAWLRAGLPRAHDHRPHPKILCLFYLRGKFNHLGSFFVHLSPGFQARSSVRVTSVSYPNNPNDIF